MQILNKKTTFEDDVKIIEHEVDYESLFAEFPKIGNLVDEDSPDLFIGYDPGSRHAGLTVITTRYNVNIFSVEIGYPAVDDPIQRVNMIEKEFADIFSMYFFHPSWRPRSYVAVVEGASHGEKYGQVELAEARMVVAKYMQNFDCKNDVRILAPSSIRKKALGSGKMAGKVIWKNIMSPDAADSLVCALCAIKIHKDEKCT
jgi:Holliday junction resolvasome RuvABC endonuclease subunit